MAFSDNIKPLAFLVQSDNKIMSSGQKNRPLAFTKVIFKYLAWGIVGAAIMAGLYFGLPAIILGSIGFFAILLGAASGIGAALLATGIGEAFDQHHPFRTAWKMVYGLLMVATVALAFVSIPVSIISIVVVSFATVLWWGTGVILYFRNQQMAASSNKSGKSPSDSPTAHVYSAQATQADELALLREQLRVAESKNAELEAKNAKLEATVAPHKKSSEPHSQGPESADFDTGGSFMSDSNSDAHPLHPAEISPLADAKAELRQVTDDLEVAKRKTDFLEVALAAKNAEIAQLLERVAEAADGAQVIQNLNDSIATLEDELRNARRAERRVSVAGMFKDGAHAAVRRADSLEHAAEMVAAKQAVATAQRERSQGESSSRRTMEEIQDDHDRLVVAAEVLNREIDFLRARVECLPQVEAACTKYEDMLAIAYSRMMSFYSVLTNTSEPSLADQKRQLKQLFESEDGVAALDSLARRLDESLSPHHLDDGCPPEEGVGSGF